MSGFTDARWACDARTESRGCAENIWEGADSFGVARYRCFFCNYDLCGSCYKSHLLLTIDVKELSLMRNSMIKDSRRSDSVAESVPQKTENSADFGSTSSKISTHQARSRKQNVF
eukprot:882373_1